MVIAVAAPAPAAQAAIPPTKGPYQSAKQIARAQVVARVPAKDFAANVVSHTQGGHTFQLPTGLFVNNTFVKSQSGKTLDVINPGNGSVICAVQEADEADVEIAFACAQHAFDQAWKTMPAPDRGHLLYKLSELLARDAEELARIEALNSGKTLTQCQTIDVPMTIQCIRYYAGWSDKNSGKTIQSQKADQFSYTVHAPIGVVGQIIPWNFPLLMLAWKIAPALACGNTVILKTAEFTPLSALKLANLCREAGFPPGVVNILSGYGPTAGAAIAKHMGIRKVAFTGSTAVGRQVMKMAAESNLKNVSLELGGKSPTIVFADCGDLDKAVHWAHFGLFFNHGQCCCAGSRIFVEDSIYDAFLEKFTKSTMSMNVGNQFDAATTQGPQVSQLQYNRIMAYIESGKAEGAKCITADVKAGDKGGFYVAPTIFTGVTDTMTIAKEEIFGPVAVVMPFSSMEEVIERANSSNYGLAAAVFTQNLTKAIKMSDQLEAGTVWVNCYNILNTQTPFGGFKESGIGRELGEYALDAYTEVKCVQINLAE